MKKHTNLLLMVFIVSATGCENQAQEEASRLGFSNIDEMKKIQAEGWHTKLRYEIDKKNEADLQAKKRGFDNADDEKNIRSKGFKTKKEYNNFQEEQRKKEMMMNDPYPFYIYISCRAGRLPAPLVNCIHDFKYNTNSKIEIKNDTSYEVYDIYNTPLLEAKNSHNGIVRLPLAKTFSFSGRNVSNDFLLSVTIQNKYTDEIVYEKSASQFEYISVSN